MRRANQSGIHTLFIAGGIHAEELAVRAAGGSASLDAAALDSTRPPWDTDAMTRLCSEFNVVPTYTLPFLV